MRGVEHIPWLYDAGCWFSERFLKFIKWRRWLVAGARGRVLEVGAGTGRNLPLYPPGSDVVALECDRRLARVARRRAPGVRHVVGSAEALPFRDGTFDTVVSGLVFCSVEDPLRGLREVRRTLRAEGRLRMIEHVRSSGWRGRYQDFIQPLWTRVAGGCHPNRHTEETVRAAGFEIEPDGRRVSGTFRRFSARPA